MRENDIRAIMSILREIKNDKLLIQGFEELLWVYNYPDIGQLIKSIQKICDIMDEWGNPKLEISLMQEIRCVMLDVEKEKSKPKVKLVIAGCYQGFMSWCNRCELNPSNYRYVPDLNHVRGYYDCEMLLIGQFWTQEDYYEIEEYCNSHNIERIQV